MSQLRVHRILQSMRDSEGAKLPELPPFLRSDVVLFLSPHQDDEALAASATLARAIRQGASVHVALITDGNRRGKKEIRHKEFAEVLHQIGVPESNRHIFDYPNGTLTRVPQEEVVKKVSELIQAFGVTHLFAPHLSDLHGEHRYVGQVAEQICKARDGQLKLLQYLTHFPPSFPKPRRLDVNRNLYPPLSLVNPRTGQWVVQRFDFDEVMHKLRIVELYQSQLKTLFLRSLMYSLVRKNELFFERKLTV